MSPRIALGIVIPIYNEAQAIGAVLHEWLPAWRAVGAPFRLWVVDDGSTDQTPDRLRSLAADIPELTVIRQSNAGHGPACLRGYREALAAGCDWVFQIDSDGQCDPRYWGACWNARAAGEPVFGWRRAREDGRIRQAVSFALAAFVAVAARTRVKDPNVPYRLIPRDPLARVIGRVPPGAALANVVLSVLIAKSCSIRWIPIGFRDRWHGSSKHNFRRLPALMAGLWRDLRSALSPAAA